MKNKKQTRDALRIHGLAMMDKAVAAKFGIDCNTHWSDEKNKWVTITSDTDIATIAYIAGYQQALNDMFIAARL